MIKQILLPLALSILVFSCGPDTSETDNLVITEEPAIARLTASINAQPKDASLYAARAELFEQSGAYDEALADWQQAVQLDASQADYYHALANLQLDYFQSRNALATMELAAERFPERTLTLLKLSEFQLILKQYEESMRTIDQVLRLNPQEPEAYFMFGLNFREMGDTARAINSFQQAVEINPEMTDAYLILGQLHAEIGSPLAERYYDNAISIDTTAVLPIASKGDFLFNKGALAAALALYRRAARLDPQYEEAHFNTGLVLMEMDSLEAAARAFNITLEVDPLHIQSYFFRGYAAELLGDSTQALRDYQHALRLAPDYQLPQEGVARLR